MQRWNNSRSRCRRRWLRTINVNNNDRVVTKRDHVVAQTGPQLDTRGSPRPNLDTREAAPAYWIHNQPGDTFRNCGAWAAGQRQNMLPMDRPLLYLHHEWIRLNASKTRTASCHARTAPRQTVRHKVRNPWNTSDFRSRRPSYDNPYPLGRKRIRRVPWRNNLSWRLPSLN